MQGTIMKDKIYKEPKTKQEKVRASYMAIFCISGGIIVSRLIANPGSRWLFWVSIVWCIIVLFYGSKAFIFKDKFAGKKLEEKEEMMENESKSE
jgi:phosphotransferase system  glucose/maltose/N-acetylglucosamine-specific IIC component